MNTQLLQSLRKHQVHPGTWLSLGSTVTTEIVSQFSFDWLLIDLEHGVGTEAALLPQLQAAGENSALIVRIGHVDASLIARTLDWGADGIMLPHVETIETAKACLDHMLYPPRGHRGFSASVRTYRYGLQKVQPADQPAPLFMAQIETWKGVENASEIASLPGVDVLFIGPTDLKADLAASSLTEKVDIEACIDRVISAAAQHGKQTGIVLKNREELHARHRQGIQFLSLGSDLLCVRDGMQEFKKMFGEIS